MMRYVFGGGYGVFVEAGVGRYTYNGCFGLATLCLDLVLAVYWDVKGVVLVISCDFDQLYSKVSSAVHLIRHKRVAGMDDELSDEVVVSSRPWEGRRVKGMPDNLCAHHST